jgi:hypothetical protein
MKNQDALNAVTELMALVPAHRRHEVREACRLLLELAGYDINEHGYLFDKRPKKVSNTVGGVYLPPRLAKRQYGFRLEVNDGEDGRDNSTPLIVGLTSLYEISRFVDRIPETVEGWMNQRKRTTNGVTVAPHSRLEGYGHQIRFWVVPESDCDFTLPDLFPALDAVKKTSAARYAKKY